MTHPTAGELLELHFDEKGGAGAARVRAHASACADCSRLLADLAWAERLLAVAPEARPPADGLQRVLAVVDSHPPAARRRGALAAALPSLAAVLAGGAVLAVGGVTAGALFLATGCLLTLSLAPMLILEARDERGTNHTAAR